MRALSSESHRLCRSVAQVVGSIVCSQQPPAAGPNNGPTDDMIFHWKQQSVLQQQSVRQQQPVLHQQYLRGGANPKRHFQPA